MSFSPVTASREIAEKYHRYLRTIFRIADPDYSRQFNQALNNESMFAKGPYLDVTDAFEKGSSVGELMVCGVLSSGFRRLGVPIDRKLYRHQEIAIRKAIAGENLVVSTGTGSGKTESFLIPVINYLFREREQGNLGPGVRALIIYPMNALANDQVERLRVLLKDCPEITYGSYTGQTEQRFHDALAEYQSLNEGQAPMRNELISRDQMIATPPHILITNYAMLEYLMIRPQESVFFSSEYAHRWKFIVLDEAHVYSGSTGIEVSMLLRRLKAKLNNHQLQYILTSATLGSDPENELVASFAHSLCNSSFPAGNVVRAHRREPVPASSVRRLPVDFYSHVSGLRDVGHDNDQLASWIRNTAGHIATGGSLQEHLYEAILSDENYWNIRAQLKDSPRTVSALAIALGWSEKQVQDFVAVASMTEKGGDRLFDARYHMFLRATESVFVTLNPSKRLFLNRKAFHYEGEERFKVFEIAVCSFCSAIYLVGEEQGYYLEQNSKLHEVERRCVYLLADAVSDDDEDQLIEDAGVNYEAYDICAQCGYLRPENLVNKRSCEHGNDYMTRVYRIRATSPAAGITKCLACENTSPLGILRMFFTGQESVTSVLGTALFEALPAYKVTRRVNLCQYDDTGFGAPEDEEKVIQERIAKQFLAFSDNRQAAAFYATYLETTYRSLLYKRLIMETLDDHAFDDAMRTTDFHRLLTAQFERHGIATGSTQASSTEAWKALLAELVDNNSRTSLFGMGLLGIALNSRNISANRQEDLSQEDVTALCSVFVLGMMSEAALHYPANLARVDREFFAHGGVEHSYTYSAAENVKYRKSFIPSRAHMSNKRLDYLMRVFARKGRPISKEKALKFLGAIWHNILCRSSDASLVQSEGSYRIDVAQVMLSSGLPWYRCSTCRKITSHNVAGVCPSFKCEGILEPVNCNEEFKDDHYRHLYQHLNIRDLRVVEHTAQLSKETAYEYQKQFQRKEIDVLSCSTTFELGVDVGSLETVFMRNMPPSPANYAQRAGRAGRNKQSAAYAVTFCTKSSHDFTFFRHPENMIRGRINPPRFNVENDKIAIRHVYASALGHFWNTNPAFFGQAKNFAEQGANASSGAEVFENYLEERPSNLRHYLQAFLPPALSARFEINSYGWLERLLGPDGVLRRAMLDYRHEVGLLNEAINTALEKGRGVDGMRNRLKVYQREPIISLLSRKNVLPKYGFPVDVVEMTVIDRQNQLKAGLQLQRDMAVAISEYAPDSQIVANGHLITSRYIRKLPGMGWRMHYYLQCKTCKTLNVETYIEDVNEHPLPNCRQCGTDLRDRRPQVFLIPSFGFEADGNAIRKPSLKKPERTYRGETAYVGHHSAIDFKSYEIGCGSIMLAYSTADEMATLNESRFFVCETCGYTELDEAHYKETSQRKHERSTGHICPNKLLRHRALGYRFETDVVQILFTSPALMDWETALSVLYGVLRGTCLHLSIEESDVSGCLQYYCDSVATLSSYALVIFDRTPGGAGYVKQLNNNSVLQSVLESALRLMKACDCGGEEADASCYSCLRGYYNQRQHDTLKRGKVLAFLRHLLRS